MRYQKFILDKSEIPDCISPIEEGLIAIPTNISEVEQCENMSQSKIIEAIFYTICELFEIHNMELQTTGYYNSFLLITKTETEFNMQEGIESPQLSRNKLKKASPKEVSDAVIDIVLNRNNWTEKRSYKTIHID